MAAELESIFGQTTIERVRDIVLNYGEILLALLIAFLGGYILGYIVSKVFSKVLLIGNLQKTLVMFGTITTKLWESIVHLIAQYMIWWIVFFSVHSVLSEGYNIEVMGGIVNFLTGTGYLIAFTVIGLLLGGFLFKVVKDSLEAIGLDNELERHIPSDSLGGTSLSTILAGIVKWFIFLIFLTTGLQILLGTLLEILKPGELLLVDFLEEFVRYIPNAILGVLVILAAVILSLFISSNIKRKSMPFTEPLALGVEIVILFFGVVLALPRLFNVNDPEVFKTSLSLLVDSFKLIVAGVSLGLAIALGWGLKDSIAKLTKDL
ncbi:MAG: hypothetical protein U9Q22_04020 [Candidatus Altiarchaeota archaeon]|nr:hypothetical protein [Candidatus Altiarchaeota archaeon]